MHPTSHSRFALLSIIVSLTSWAFIFPVSIADEGTKNSKGIVIKDARGLGIPLQSIGKAAAVKSADQLVILTFAGLQDSAYVDMVHSISMGQYHSGHEKLLLLIYDLPEGKTDGMTVLYYKGEMTLPVTYKADRSGASLTTLIRRVYQDHYLPKCDMH